jgi:hypothetical protein
MGRGQATATEKGEDGFQGLFGTRRGEGPRTAGERLRREREARARRIGTLKPQEQLVLALFWDAEAQAPRSLLAREAVRLRDGILSGRQVAVALHGLVRQDLLEKREGSSPRLDRWHPTPDGESLVCDAAYVAEHDEAMRAWKSKPAKPSDQEIRLLMVAYELQFEREAKEGAACPGLSPSEIEAGTTDLMPSQTAALLMALEDKGLMRSGNAPTGRGLLWSVSEDGVTFLGERPLRSS